MPVSSSVQKFVTQGTKRGAWRWRLTMGAGQKKPKPCGCMNSKGRPQVPSAHAHSWVGGRNRNGKQNDSRRDCGPLSADSIGRSKNMLRNSMPCFS
eukprot:3298455-Pleurochrysis_carterae.AAC.3